MSTSAPIAATVQKAIETALSERFRTPVEITGTQNFPYAQVHRCTLHAADSAAVPRTVILRLPREGVARAGSAPLDTERAALEYLATHGLTLAPRYFAGSATTCFLITEDLGTAPLLLDLLLGNNAEAATRGALAFGHTLAALHTHTRGGQAENIPQTRLSLAKPWEQVRNAVTQLGLLAATQSVERDITEILLLLDHPGDHDLIALSSGDPSVVNCKVTPSGGVRFFDFEEACFRHAFLDSSMLRFLYPTGGPPWRLPEQIVQQSEATYRAELARACPAVADDTFYEPHMAAACAVWMIFRLARLPRVDTGPDRDSWPLLPPDWTGPPPTRSRRRQLLSILETGTAPAKRARTLAALADWIEHLAEALRARWPEAAEALPLYPAFEKIKSPR